MKIHFQKTPDQNISLPSLWTGICSLLLYLKCIKSLLLAPWLKSTSAALIPEGDPVRRGVGARTFVQHQNNSSSNKDHGSFCGCVCTCLLEMLRWVKVLKGIQHGFQTAPCCWRDGEERRERRMWSPEAVSVLISVTPAILRKGNQLFWALLCTQQE